MKITVIGAGAVGCFYGAMLARAGHPVTLVGRPVHVDSVTRHGLRFESPAMDTYIAVAADTRVQAAEDADLVLVCVKSADTVDAARQLRPFLKADAAVLSLQNGIDNAAMLEGALGRPVIAAAVYVACEMAGPGHLRHHGRGDLVIGDSPQSADIARMLGAAGVPTVVSADVRVPLWDKLVLNCAYNALSGIANLPYGEIRNVEAAEETMKQLIAECLAVACAERVGIDLDVERQFERIRHTIPAGQYSSMAQDLARARPTEIDYLNGAIVRRGLAHGIATPVNQALMTLVQLLERRPAARGS